MTQDASREAVESERAHWKRWSDINAAVAKRMQARAEAAEARVTELEGLLREAREDLGGYLDADYPEGSRAKYPEIRRRWNRDMDLCRRIDEALNGGDDNG